MSKVIFEMISSDFSMFLEINVIRITLFPQLNMYFPTLVLISKFVDSPVTYKTFIVGIGYYFWKNKLNDLLKSENFFCSRTIANSSVDLFFNIQQ